MTELQPLQYLDLKHVPGLLAAPGHTSHSLCRPLHLCQRCQVDSTAFSISVDILVELTNRVVVNPTHISTNIETAMLSNARFAFKTFTMKKLVSKTGKKTAKKIAIFLTPKSF